MNAAKPGNTMFHSVRCRCRCCSHTKCRIGMMMDDEIRRYLEIMMVEYFTKSWFHCTYNAAKLDGAPPLRKVDEFSLPLVRALAPILPSNKGPGGWTAACREAGWRWVVLWNRLGLIRACVCSSKSGVRFSFEDAAADEFASVWLSVGETTLVLDPWRHDDRNTGDMIICWFIS